MNSFTRAWHEITTPLASVVLAGTITYRLARCPAAERYGKEKQYTASVIHGKSWRRENLARELVKRHTGLSLGQTLAVLIELETLGRDLMARGDIINLGFVRCYATITGLVGNDGRLTSANKIIIRATTTQRFKAVAAHAPLLNLTPPPPPSFHAYQAVRDAPVAPCNDSTKVLDNQHPTEPVLRGETFRPNTEKQSLQAPPYTTHTKHYIPPSPLPPPLKHSITPTAALIVTNSSTTPRPRLHSARGPPVPTHLVRHPI